MRYFGFLSFDHYSNGGRYDIAVAKPFHQAIDLSVVADELGVNSAFFRIHRFAAQMAASMPPLSTIASYTKAIGMGTGVINMRCENPLYLAEGAVVLDLIADGRTAPGVSRGASEIASRRWESFGYRSEERNGTDPARAHCKHLLDATGGEPVAEATPLHEQYPTQMNPGTPLPAFPHSPGLQSRIWYGAESNASAIQVARDGINLMSSTLVFEHGDKLFGNIQAERLCVCHQAWAQTGRGWTPRVSASYSVSPLLSERDRGLYGPSTPGDQARHLDSSTATFGCAYAVAPSTSIKQLNQDHAPAKVSTLLLMTSSQLGSEENRSIIRNFTEYVAPALGWEPVRPGVLPVGYEIDGTVAE